ncbi:MAG: EVE domain-containing protein, partial [Pseudomonas sp.]|nr:EVE domain-containing protein [Pseudomonas sp.]
MPYWLMKSEPDEFSIANLQQLETGRWDGVRNYQARNFLRNMIEGDLFFFYHYSCAVPCIAGIGKFTRSAYQDPTALDPDCPYYDSKATTS